MRAAWYERTGAAREVLVVGQMPAAEPGPGEVRVALKTSGVNPSDVKARSVSAVACLVDGRRSPRKQQMRGKMRVMTEGTVRDLGPGEAVLFPPDAPHQTTMLVDTEVVSVKGVIGGVHKI
jgi:NADPH:quinone reductase-like Zn-dependent oxidoreductase